MRYRIQAVAAPSECSDSSKSSESDNESTIPETAVTEVEGVETTARFRRIAPIIPARVLNSEHSSRVPSKIFLSSIIFYTHFGTALD